IVERNFHARCGVKFQRATLDYRRTAGDALLEVRKAAVRYLDRAACVIDRGLDIENAALVGRQCTRIGNPIAAGVESECLLARVSVDCAAVLVDEPKAPVSVAYMACADGVAVVCNHRAIFDRHYPAVDSLDYSAIDAAFVDQHRAAKISRKRAGV